MNMHSIRLGMKKITILDCSYENSVKIDEITSLLNNFFITNNIDVKIVLVDQTRIASCNECRICMQGIETIPQKCVHQDQMDDIIDLMEESQAFVFLSDTNSMFKANKVFRRFSKRLAGYYYWPFGVKSSQHRKKVHDKLSVLINYNTTLGLFNSSYSNALEQLKTSSIAIGAEPIASLTITPVKEHEDLTEVYFKDIELCAYKLLRGLEKSESMTAS